MFSSELILENQPLPVRKQFSASAAVLDLGGGPLLCLGYWIGCGSQRAFIQSNIFVQIYGAKILNQCSHLPPQNEPELSEQLAASIPLTYPCILVKRETRYPDRLNKRKLLYRDPP